MSTTRSKHLYFRSESRNNIDYDSGAADTGNERSFDSENGTMRDQSIQQGNGLIRRTTRKSNSTVGKKKTNDNKYVSPFILSAEKKAQERSRLYQENKRRQRKPEWNDRPVQSGSLFDPSIHKQEIFKIEPRRKTTDNINDKKQGERYQQQQRPYTTGSSHDPRNSSIDEGRLRNPGRSGMTIRTSGNVPIQQNRINNRYNTNRHKEAGTSPLQAIPIEQQQSSDSTNSYSNIGSNNTGSSNNKNINNQENLPGLAVTRSTSPIQQDIVKSILKEDGLIHNTTTTATDHDNYMIHIKSYQEKDLPLSDHDHVYDTLYNPPPPPAEVCKDEEYYSNLLRNRLRHILLDYNNNKERLEGNDQVEVEVERTDYEDMNTSSAVEYSHHKNNMNKRNNYMNNYEQRKYLRRIHTNNPKYNHPPHTTSATSTAAATSSNNTTEELMKSMAAIMTAVGNIVSKPKPLKYKTVLKKYQRQHQQSPHRYQQISANHNNLLHHSGNSSSSSNMQCNQGNTNSTVSHYTPTNDIQLPLASTTMPTSYSTTATTNITHKNQKPSPAIAQVSTSPIAQFLQSGVPRNKAAMIDTILMKIQAMEAAEAQTLQYLATTTNNRGNSSGFDSCDLDQNNAYATTAATTAATTTATTATDSACSDIRLLDVTNFNVTRERAAALNNSLAVEADISEACINTAEYTADVSNIPNSNTPTTTTATATNTVSKHYSDAGTQDSPHTLSHIHHQLENLHRNTTSNTTVGASITTLQQQHEQENAKINELNIIQLKERTHQYIKTLPAVKVDQEKDEIIKNYSNELNTCRELKDVAFRSRGVSMAQVADRMTEEIFTRMVESVASELDTCMEEYSQKFLDKI